MIREHELTPSELAAFDILVIKKGPAKLTFEQVEEIRRVGSSVSQRALGKRYGVGHAVIGSILRGTAWTRR